MSTLRAAATVCFLALAACGQHPTLLADMGDVDVAVRTLLWSDDGPGQTGVALTPAAGCPTFTGEATLNGVSIALVEPGHNEAGGYYLVPTVACDSPYFVGRTVVAEDDSLSLRLSDDSDTWTLAADAGYSMGYTVVGGTTAHPGDTVVLEWSGPALPESAGVSAYQDGEIWGSRLADGAISIELPERLVPGPLELHLQAHVFPPVDTCDGFAACLFEVDYQRTLTIEIE